MRPWERFKEHDDRRQRAWELYTAGLTGQEIADRLGLHVRTIWRWLAKMSQGGPGASKRAAYKGRPCKLSVHEQDLFQKLLVRNSRGLGLGPGPWTLDKVQKALFIRFNIMYGNQSTIKLMEKLGWRLSGRIFQNLKGLGLL